MAIITPDMIHKVDFPGRMVIVSCLLPGAGMIFTIVAHITKWKNANTDANKWFSVGGKYANGLFISDKDWIMMITTTGINVRVISFDLLILTIKALCIKM